MNKIQRINQIMPSDKGKIKVSEEVVDSAASVLAIIDSIYDVRSM